MNPIEKKWLNENFQKQRNVKDKGRNKMNKELISSGQIQELEADQKVYVALTPEALEASKAHVIHWCTEKIADIKTQRNQIQENFRVAKKNKWRTSILSSALSKFNSRINFYRKIQVATEAGYLIVPDFPTVTFAVRVDREYPRPNITTNWNVPEQRSNNLPLGVGRYVSSTTSNLQREKSTAEGKKFTEYWAHRFREIEFPVVMAKPVLLNATAQAMQLKVFDSIGLVQKTRWGNVGARRGDPIVIGTVEIRQGYSVKRVNFFIGWWLDYKDL